MAITILMGYRAKSRRKSFQDNSNTGEILKIGKEINRAVSMGYDCSRVGKEFGKDANNICAQKPQVDTVARDLAREAVRQIKNI